MRSAAALERSDVACLFTQLNMGCFFSSKNIRQQCFNEPNFINELNFSKGKGRKKEGTMVWPAEYRVTGGQRERQLRGRRRSEERRPCLVFMTNVITSLEEMS